MCALAVSDDRVQPGPERHLPRVGAQGAEGADERVLDDLLRVVVGAAEDLAGVRDEARLVAVVDSVEGTVVARAHEVDELLVARRRVRGRVEEDLRHASSFGSRACCSQGPQVARSRTQVDDPAPLGGLKRFYASL